MIRTPKPWAPHDYQKTAIRFLLEHANAGLFADPGTGKTSTTLAAIKILLSKKLISRVLILAPLRVCYSVWPHEIAKWSDFCGLRCVVLHGKDKVERLKEDADIYLLNYEGLEWFALHDGFSTINADTLVIDELSKMRHSQTRRFRILKPYLDRFHRRWGLTGSPAPNGLLDLFGQVFVLDRGKSLGPYISHFRMKYFNAGGYGNHEWTIKPGAAEEIYRQLEPLVLRLDAQDYLDLPELVESVVTVELPPEARRVYDELERKLFSEINGENVLALSAAAASLKCRQVANGGIYRQDASGLKLDGQGNWFPLHNEKTAALVDLVEELQGSPLLVAYDFHHDLERLQKAFPRAPYIGSGVSAKASDEICERWNAGQIPLLFGHPASVGHGLNLQGAGNHVAWYSLTWDLELYEQFVRRVFRQGNKFRHVFVHHFLAKDTVDVAVLRALRRKTRVQGGLLDALRDYSRLKKMSPEGLDMFFEQDDNGIQEGRCQ